MLSKISSIFLSVLSLVSFLLVFVMNPLVAVVMLPITITALVSNIKYVTRAFKKQQKRNEIGFK